MQRITIFENDNTFNTARQATNTSSVLIPGFASKVDDDDAQAKLGEIIECASVAEFKAQFGYKPPIILAKDNIFPLKGEIKAKDTLKTVAAMHEKYNKDAAAHDPEHEYKINDQCIYSNSLWKAKVEGKGAWNEDNWSLLLTSGDYITIEKDEEHASAKTQYLYTVKDNKGEFEYKPIVSEGFPEIAIPTGDELGTKTNTPMYPTAADGKVYDPSWMMAYKLLLAGMHVAYVRMNTYFDPNTTDTYDVSPVQAYKYMHEELFKTNDPFSLILDKNINIAFITSGGYPVLEHSYEIASLMITLAEMKVADTKTTTVTGRGDCAVLLDHTNNPLRPLTGKGSVFESDLVSKNNYAAVFTPWVKTNIDKLKEAPATFAYLYAVAEKGGADASWNSIAGISRGRCTIVAGLNTNKTLTNKIAEYYLNDFDDKENTHASLNPITYIRNYGYCLWGDRTCECYKNGDKGLALSFLHIRNLVSAVKKKVYTISQELMFETNNELLWTKFKSRVSELLDEMVAANLLSNYAFTKITPSNDLTALYATLTLYPTYGLEKVEITVNLENEADAVITESTEDED